jgi:hypothetical protein
VAQILSTDQDLLPHLYDLFIRSRQVQLDFLALCTELLRSCFSTLHKAYIVIDGIDECKHEERETILSFFTSLIDGATGRLRGLFVSRCEDDIQHLLKATTVIQVTETLNQRDIEAYTAYWAGKIKQKFELPDAAEEYLKRTVCANAKGMIPNCSPSQSQL